MTKWLYRISFVLLVVHALWMIFFPSFSLVSIILVLSGLSMLFYAQACDMRRSD